MSKWEEWRVSTTGDAEHGWLVDIHDGVNSAVYNPTGETLADVEKAAKTEHSGKYWPVAANQQTVQLPPATPEPEPEPEPEPTQPPAEHAEEPAAS